MTFRKTVDISEARKSLCNIMIDENVVYIAKHGKLLFALCSMGFFETVEETLEILNDPKAAQMLLDSIKDLQKGKVHSHESIRKNMG